MFDMNGSVSDANNLDSDLLLPPRKRLLVGLKRHSCSESTSHCSHENNRSPSPSSQTPLTEFDIRLNNLFKSYKNGSNMSPEEIAMAAGSAAVAVAKLAEVARAAAEEKAAIAAKAVAAVRTALDLVALISEKKNKSKKLKISPTNEKIGIGNGASVTDGDLMLSLARKILSVRMDGKVWKSSKCEEIDVSSGEVKSNRPQEKRPGPLLEGMCIDGRKRGRIKQKRLPLSVCRFKDQANPKELNVKKSLLADKSITHHVSLLSMETSSDYV